MKITHNKSEYLADDEFSFKDFTGRSFTDCDLKGKVIVGSCFSQEAPDSRIFSDNMTGVTFLTCNLDNVFIPAGNTITDCSTRRFKVQNDLNDWEVDENNVPVRPLDTLCFTKKGLEIPNPDCIPAEKISERMDLVKVAQELKE